MINLKKLYLITALLSISFGANAVEIHAASESLGVASPDHFVSTYTFETDAIIDDVYLFDILDGTIQSILAATATSIELSPAFGISDFKFALTDKDGVVISDWGMTGDSVDFSQVAGDSTYGVYYKGVASGSFGGIITGVTAIAPVPVPTAVWLFGSAMFGLLGISRSRKIKS